MTSSNQDINAGPRSRCLLANCFNSVISFVPFALDVFNRISPSPVALLFLIIFKPEVIFSAIFFSGMSVEPTFYIVCCLSSICYSFGCLVLVFSGIYKFHSVFKWHYFFPLILICFLKILGFLILCSVIVVSNVFPCLFLNEYI